MLAVRMSIISRKRLYTNLVLTTLILDILSSNKAGQAFV